MKMLLVRDILNSRFTLGTLLLDGTLFCHTLEDAVREIPGAPVEQWKIKGETAIPRGTYHVTIDMSTRFKRLMLHVLDVPGFAGIRVHGGNTAADVEGCIAVGQERTPTGVRNCKDVLAQLEAMVAMDLARGMPVSIEVR